MRLGEIIRELDLLIASLDSLAFKMGMEAETPQDAKLHRQAVAIWTEAKELRAKLLV